MAARSAMTVVSTTTIATSWGNNVRDHVIPRTTSNDVSSEGQLAVNTSTDQIVVHDGSSAVQFGGYGTPNALATPQFFQTGLTGVGITLSGEFTRYGNHYVANGSMAVTSVVSAGTAGNVIAFSLGSLPAVTLQRCVGSYVFQDASTAQIDSGALLMIAGSNQMYMYGGGTSAIGITPSIGLNVGDTVWFQINYHDV